MAVPARQAERLAREQHGVLSREQAIGVGMTHQMIRHRVASGRWSEPLPGVYRVGGAPATWHSRVMAAILWVGNGAVATRRTAARLWQLERFADGPSDEVIELAVWHGKPAPDPSVRVHRLRTSDRPRIRRVEGIPVTDPARTLLDIAAVAAPRAVGSALDDALRRRLTTLGRLTAILSGPGGRGRKGTALLRRLLDLRGGAHLESSLELRLHGVIGRSSLPPPKTQHEVRVGGRLLGRLDFAWPESKVGAEADGYATHGGHDAWQADRRRDNRFARAGWTILRFTWDDVVGDPAGVVTTIAAVLPQRPRRSSPPRRRHV